MRFRLGLRGEIILALSLVFLLSAPLLATVTVELTRRAGAIEKHRLDTLSAQALSGAASRIGPDDAHALRKLADDFADSPQVQGVRIVLHDGSRQSAGELRGEPEVRVALPSGTHVAMWPTPRSRASDASLQRLLTFYVGLTGVAVIVLAYVLLTLLIVRPLEQVVRSAQALAAHEAGVRVPEQGPAELLRLATSFNDMAEQLKRERLALQQRLAELERTTGQLQSTQQHLVHGEKLATVGRLAAGVAHEIGNPLAAILGLVELLRGGELPAQQQQEFLARIQTETERIHGIIRELLDYSRSDAAAESPEQSADVEQVLRDALGLVAPQKKARGVTIDVDIGAELPRVVGAETRLTQVVLNLVLNAVDAVDGKGTVHVSASTGDDEHVQVSVRDDGPGIDPEILAHIFEPFTTSKAVGQGTGLGLAVCHSLVEGMGGTIEATNCEGGGARFDVTLRAVESAA